MTLEAAKLDFGEQIMGEMNDPRYKGMQKMEIRVESENGRDSVVHYFWDPRTEELLDFKFKKHSNEGRGIGESTRDPKSGPMGQEP